MRRTPIIVGASDEMRDWFEGEEVSASEGRVLIVQTA